MRHGARAPASGAWAILAMGAQTISVRRLRGCAMTDQDTPYEDEEVDARPESAGRRFRPPQPHSRARGRRRHRRHRLRAAHAARVRFGSQQREPAQLHQPDRPGRRSAAGGRRGIDLGGGGDRPRAGALGGGESTARESSTWAVAASSSRYHPAPRSRPCAGSRTSDAVYDAGRVYAEDAASQ